MRIVEFLTNRRTVAAWIGMWFLVAPLRAVAQNIAANEELIDGRPFDTLVLKDPPEEFRVEPLKLQPRKPITEIASDRVFEVHLLRFPDRTYRIRGEAIAKIVLFEERVLEAIRQDTEEGDFESAYRALRFLDRFSPKFPGLKEAHLATRFAEARRWTQKRDWEHAWLVLLEIAKRDRMYNGAASLMASVARQLIERDLERKQDRAAYARYESFSRYYPDHPARAEMESLLKSVARSCLREAETAAEKGDWPRAFSLARRAKRLWHEPLRESDLEAELWSRHPILVVGVRQLVPSGPADWGDWVTKRRAPLLAPQGPFQLAKTPQGWARLRRPSGSGSGPVEVIERLIEEGQWEQLWSDRDVALVDRIWPWEVRSWRRKFGDQVHEYRRTSVHFLVVNPRATWLQDPLARRAIRDGIARQRIVDELTGGADGDAIGWPSALPIPRGASDQRPVVPRYRPEVMVAGLRRAWRAATGEESRPKLTLVCISDPLAIRACEALRRQWELAGLGPHVTIRTLDSLPPSGEWDIAYVSWYGMEPQRDLVLLLRKNSPLGFPPVEVASILAESGSDAELSPSQVDRVAATATTTAVLIPLWEFREFCLVQKNLAGAPQQPVSLYDGIEQWHYETER